MIERDLRKFLADSGAVRNAADGGIWPNQSPQGRRGRRLILRRISSDRNYSLQNEVELSQHIVQIDAYGETPSAAHDLFQVVRNRLSGYRGKAGDGAIEGVVIVSERSLSEQPEDRSDKWVHRYSADFEMHYSEKVPTHL